MRKPVDLERTLVLSAVKDNAILGYLVSRLTVKDLTDQASKAAWTALSAGKQPSDRTIQALEEGRHTVFTAQELPQVKEAVKKLKTESALRKVYQISAYTLKSFQNRAAKDPEEFITGFARAAAQIALPTSANDAVKAPAEWMTGAYQEIQQRRQETQPRWFNLGMPSLTDALAAEPGHLIILAAETGKGKTALALNIASKLGVQQSQPTLYCNTEMSWQELSFRVYALLSGANLFNLRAGRSSDSEMRDIEKVLKSKQVGNSLYLTDALPWATTEDICAMAREYAVTAGLKILVVDYIQRLESKDNSEQWQSLLSAAKTFKSLAQELRVLVLMVAQLNGREQLAGSSGMARECDAWANLEELTEDERLDTVATHRIRLKKSRHTGGGNSIDIILDPESLKIVEVSSGPADSELGQLGIGGCVEQPLDNLPEEWCVPGAG